MLRTERMSIENRQRLEAAGISAEDTLVCFHDSRLLLQRLAVLRIDSVRLASEDPIAFRELQKNCSMCVARDPCIRDLVRDAVEPTNSDWKEYCPNVAALNMFSALAALTE